ncbi:hypothetical protein [Mixta gaviniae]|uniref:DUF1918 domain-containing protein n=1 Tax=Mixta gaviniae TaxID=665914 RepID=A0A1X1DHN3_9GAMM|nr:hypothetical protein [Mixta gaviniae]AUX93107.1 hypothetical protein C2E15_08430 [Mixta gaviniae]ORM76232.1 hypothetical protein HA44_15735 [Mixta gaviniae]
MSKYAKGAIVKHHSGEIRGEVTAVFCQGNFPASYHVRWDDGTWSLHAEKELIPGDDSGDRPYHLPRPAS